MILFVLAITLVPMLYLILSGFRTTGQLGSNPNGLPHPWVWSNYASILESAVFWQAVLNSAIIAVVATALAMVLGSMAAFALSRYTFRGRDGLFLLFTAGLLFPLNTAALPLFLLLQKIGMNDNLFGVALPEAGVLAAGHHRHPAPVQSCGRSLQNWRTWRPWTAPPGSGSSCRSCFRCPGPP